VGQVRWVAEEGPQRGLRAAKGSQHGGFGGLVGFAVEA